MADGETDLVALLEDLGSALLTAAQALSSAADEKTAADTRVMQDRGILVFPDETIVVNVDNPLTDVEMPRLRNIFTNISRHADEVQVYFDELDTPRKKADARRQVGMQRRLMTIRDSSGQAATLLNGESLPGDPLPDSHPAKGLLSDDEFAESGYDGPMVQPPEAQAPDSCDEFLSSIYQELRALQSDHRIRQPEANAVITRLEAIMTKIRDRQDEKRKNG